jgi:protein-export membrane protein SecD
VWQPAPRDLQIKQGLDLKGGLQVLLASNLEDGSQPTTEQMDTAKQIIDSRVNGLGVSEPIVQRQGNDRVLVELPGITDRQLAIDLIKQTGLLEFVDAGNTPLQSGALVSTTYQVSHALLYPETTKGGIPISNTAAAAPGGIMNTAFTGEVIQDANTGLDQVSQWVVSFRIRPAYQTAFGQYTGSKIGQAMCIVLDHKVISCPTIRASLPTGGQISGSFDKPGAESLATTLNYGSLPVPLKIETTRDIGATLGTDSIRRSLIAGVIGLVAMVVFLVLYYRLPGVLGGLSILFFTVSTLALFVLLPVTLTLPGIAGFVLSIATAVDANILIFERFKEELRAGRTVRAAVEAAFQRAWPSIRDSNTSTLITCLVLFFFGGTFGASAVRGFAINLALGIGMSLFCAMFVTRTFMRLAFSNQPAESAERRKALLGV